MDLDQLAKLGEFIGGMVVVVSLVYLALQARQSAITQRAENYERTNARASAVLSQLANNAELNRIFVDGSINFEQLDPYEKARMWWVIYDFFSYYEFAYEQYKMNAIPDYVWEKFRTYVVNQSKNPGIRACWTYLPMNWSPGFTT